MGTFEGIVLRLKVGHPYQLIIRLSALFWLTGQTIMETAPRRAWV